MTIFALIVIVLAIFLDVFTLNSKLKYEKSRKEPSGIPFSVNLALYYIGFIILYKFNKRGIILEYVFMEFLFILLFHMTFRLFIPETYAFFKKPEGRKNIFQTSKEIIEHWKKPKE